MHIDPSSELQTSEQPIVEEPDDHEQETQQQEEDPQTTPDETTADPNEEGEAGSCKSQHTINYMFTHMH